MTEMIKRWNGLSKRTDNMTFTIHYDDGTSTEVKDGVLFTVNDMDTMDVHVGVGKKWQLFGVFLSFTELIRRMGLEEEFDEYMNQMMFQAILEENGMTQDQAERKRKREKKSKDTVIRGIWHE
jgi:hypothetical protein